MLYFASFLKIWCNLFRQKRNKLLKKDTHWEKMQRWSFEMDQGHKKVDKDKVVTKFVLYVSLINILQSCKE